MAVAVAEQVELPGRQSTFLGSEWDSALLAATGSPRSLSPSSVSTAPALVSSGASDKISTEARVLWFQLHLSCR